MAESGVIGDISLLYGQHRDLQRASVNPYDKSTVVSIYNKRIHELKPTIQPGEFIIEPGTYEKPTILVVGPSSWWKDTDPYTVSSPLLEIPVSSIEIARSIVQDYCNGIVACNMNDVMPGLFYVPGEFTVADILSGKKTKIGATEISLKVLLDRSNARQRKWFEVLVNIADNLWTRTNGNPISISDDMKMAATELGLRDKEWLATSIITHEMIRCVACGAMRDPKFPICGACHTIIDKKAYDTLNLKQV